MNEQEETLIRSFVDRRKQDRYLSLLSSTKGRKKFLEALYHNFANDLDQRYSFQENHLPSKISQQIDRLMGSNDISCYIICTDPAIDAQEMKLEDALRQRDLSAGLILSVVTGRLAYYRTEDSEPDYVLFRP